MRLLYFRIKWVWIWLRLPGTRRALPSVTGGPAGDLILLLEKLVLLLRVLVKAHPPNTCEPRWARTHHEHIHGAGGGTMVRCGWLGWVRTFMCGCVSGCDGPCLRRKSCPVQLRERGEIIINGARRSERVLPCITASSPTLSHTCGQGWLKPFRSDQKHGRSHSRDDTRSDIARRCEP